MIINNRLEWDGRMGKLWMERREENVRVTERATEVGMCEIYYLITAK